MSKKKFNHLKSTLADIAHLESRLVILQKKGNEPYKTRSVELTKQISSLSKRQIELEQSLHSIEQKVDKTEDTQKKIQEKLQSANSIIEETASEMAILEADHFDGRTWKTILDQHNREVGFLEDGKEIVPEGKYNMTIFLTTLGFFSIGGFFSELLEIDQGLPIIGLIILVFIGMYFDKWKYEFRNFNIDKKISQLDSEIGKYHGPNLDKYLQLKDKKERTKSTARNLRRDIKNLIQLPHNINPLQDDISSNLTNLNQSKSELETLEQNQVRIIGKLEKRIESAWASIKELIPYSDKLETL